MNWINKTWEDEDKEYSPKRKVNNKISWKMLHIIGSFYSHKMNKTIEYESLAECLFFYLLELCKSVIRYYVQPIEIKQYFFDKDGAKKEWVHVPDTLVFAQEALPHLYQVKDKETDSETFDQINKSCLAYAEKKNWKYSIIYSKKLPETIQRNVNFLNGYMGKRKHYDEWIPELIYRLKVLQQSSIINLAKSFMPQVSYPYILPAIYYLIARGEFYTRFTEEIGVFSEVKLASNMNYLEEYFIILGGDDIGQ